MGSWGKFVLLRMYRRPPRAAAECLLLFLTARIFRALEAMGGKLGFSRSCLRLAKLGDDIPLRSNATQHYVVNVASFEDGLNPGPKDAVLTHGGACLREARHRNDVRSPPGPDLRITGMKSASSWRRVAFKHAEPSC